MFTDLPITPKAELHRRIASLQDMVLQENMVIALEPKLIFPGKGVVGIEDTHRVTPSGLERLTSFDQSIQIIK
jgi:Xaa-Pro aminopeptidase